MSKSAIYLDYAAATPVSEVVKQAMAPYLDVDFYNPSALYLAGRAAHQTLEDARHGVAQQIGAQAGEIIFTAGATEANNLAITGVMSQFPDAELLVSTIEHPSVLQTAGRYGVELVPVNAHGLIEIEKLVSAITDKTVLISVMHANNEVGAVQPIKEVAAVVAEVRQQRRDQGNKLPLYLHSDAAQSINYLDVQVGRLGVDLLTLSAAKTYGPKQVGALFVKAGLSLQPLLYGGGQEFGRRSGTENVAGAVGLAEALSDAARRRKAETARLKDLQEYFFDEIQTVNPNIVIHGHRTHRLPNNISLSLPKLDGETAVMMLDERGIQCATGAACAASKEDPSHVLLAMGVDPAVAKNSLRLTMGRTTSKADMQYVLAQLTDILS